ncbi:hypothetical protein KOM00_01145 [Geomonas sp. Red69]|uniref:3-keto-disaccharide hydrolase domain-containing protein n=1 Tax=Geomonas diazotrophica TaxID=2843197 RepID=A0ABX8JJD8_9BACT|nr:MULTISPECIES: hypothetical protein [Geomonas]MBU5635335.1 hypothetical protein [Geomonas diazotrophica]QWV97607.1 hypothetical protein KP005_20110 [Geomonas nitrogeniifigens]QXE86750.1 hypothetical protein KP003_20775 [Geomonas nitrogeniifigens]
MSQVKRSGRKIVMCVVAALAMVAAALPALAKGAQQIGFAREAPGAEARSFSALVGTWHVDRDGSRPVYAVDGRNWEQGVMAPGGAGKAKALYGAGSAEFLAGLERYRYFPLSVCNDVKSFRGGSIEVAFKGVSGRIDQAAGIAFDIKPNGDYLLLRANALEDNLVLFRMEQGRRATVQWAGKVPVPSGQWHDLKLVLEGKRILGYLDGVKYVDQAWTEPVNGRIGLWSKADSYVFFDKFTVSEK